MKGKITINVQDLIEDIESFEETIIQDIKDKVKDFSKAAYNEALRLSSQKLGTSATQWQNNLKYEEAGKDTYIIYLVEGSPAIPFEEGFGPFDMKPGFLMSGKAKRSLKGKKYLDVPIPQYPSSKRPGSKKIVDMRSAVASVLKDRTVEKRIKEYNAQSKGLSKYGKITRYTNTKDPRTEGLVKVSPPGKGRNRYYIFRRVSENSDGKSWIHPGFQGVDIFTDLESYVQKGIEDIIRGTTG